MMGATLTNGGVNPSTGERVVEAGMARDALSVVASTGMYERSGEWLFEVGVPAKSGISGGIVMMSPGKGAVAAFSPRLDDAGNSVRGRRAGAPVARSRLDLFASRPAGTTPEPGSAPSSPSCAATDEPAQRPCGSDALRVRTTSS